MSQLTEPVEKVQGPAVGKGQSQGRVGPLGVLLTWPFPGVGGKALWQVCGQEAGSRALPPRSLPGTVSLQGPEQCPAPGWGAWVGWATGQ